MAAFTNIFLQTNSDMTYPSDESAGFTLVHYQRMLRDEGYHFVFYSTLRADLITDQRRQGAVVAPVGIIDNRMSGGDLKNVETAYTSMHSALKGFKEWRFFGVVSSNSAHYSSALLSRCAFENPGKATRPWVLINFDQHPDYGGGAKIHNGGWACYMTHKWAEEHNRAYIALKAWTSQGGQEGEGLMIMKDKDSTNEVVHYKFQKNYENEILKKLEEHSDILKDADVYITIDRDVLSKSLTHYKPGKFTWDEIGSSLSSVLSKLGKYRLVGADIVGLVNGGHQMEKKHVDGWCAEIRDISVWRQYVEGLGAAD